MVGVSALSNPFNLYSFSSFIISIDLLNLWNTSNLIN